MNSKALSEDTAEDFFHKRFQTAHWDKHDKKIQRYDFYDMIDFASQFKSKDNIPEPDSQTFSIEDMRECWQASRDHEFYQSDPAQKKYYPNFDEWISTR